VTGAYHVPVGIVTKADFVSAYQQGLTLDHAVKEMMSKNLQTCDIINLSRDGAAALLERNKTRNAIVVDGNRHFQGLISTWDIASECAKDDKAFPWIHGTSLLNAPRMTKRSYGIVLPMASFTSPTKKLILLCLLFTSTAENVRTVMRSRASQTRLLVQHFCIIVRIESFFHSSLHF
jgi:CBS-domain-containing membrane protein